MSIRDHIGMKHKQPAAAQPAKAHTWTLDTEPSSSISGKRYISNAITSNGKLIGKLVGFSEANARLIAAAPETSAELERVRQELESVRAVGVSERARLVKERDEAIRQEHKEQVRLINERDEAIEALKHETIARNKLLIEKDELKSERDKLKIGHSHLLKLITDATEQVWALTVNPDELTEYDKEWLQRARDYIAIAKAEGRAQ